MAGTRQFRTAETFFTPEANRRLFDGRAEYFIRKDLSLALLAGRSEYREDLLENRNYEEFGGRQRTQFVISSVGLKCPVV